jgi:DNA-binding transcriptional ArsR family regulator
VRKNIYGASISIKTIFISLNLIILILFGTGIISYGPASEVKPNEISGDIMGNSTVNDPFITNRSIIVLTPFVSKDKMNVAGSSLDTFIVKIKIKIKTNPSKEIQPENALEFPLYLIPICDEPKDIALICVIYLPIGLILIFSSIILYINHSNGKNNNLLDNLIRKRIFDYIKNNSGIHYRAILNDLDLPMGVLTYHLERLSKDNYIASIQDGKYKRYYIKGSEKEFRNHISDIQKAIIRIINENQGISQIKIAEIMDVKENIYY